MLQSVSCQRRSGFFREWGRRVGQGLRQSFCGCRSVCWSAFYVGPGSWLALPSEALLAALLCERSSVCSCLCPSGRAGALPRRGALAGSRGCWLGLSSLPLPSWLSLAGSCICSGWAGVLAGSLGQGFLSRPLLARPAGRAHRPGCGVVLG